jgi:Lrp/AsnC family leucine-responsive transcriptional regulator
VITVKQSKGRPKSFKTTAKAVDDVDLALLEQLQRDPRLPMAELGRRIEMSAPAVTERVQRLERLGVITGYRLEIDPAALGLPVAAFVRIRPAPGQLQRLSELARSIPQVVECHRITGEDCFLLKVHVKAVEALEEVLDRFLLYGQTTTSVLQSSPVPSRPLPLPRA